MGIGMLASLLLLVGVGALIRYHVIEWLVDATPFVPRTHCGAWEPWLITVAQLGQGIVCAAYFSVCAALLMLWQAKRETPNSWLIIAFAVVFFW